VNPYQRFLEDVEKQLSEALASLGYSGEVQIKEAPRGMGDFSYPCFLAAKDVGMPPNRLAEELAERLRPDELIEGWTAAGPYINTRFRTAELVREILSTVLDMKERYGSMPARGETVVLEHTSANPTGPLHVGRGRNPIIGDTLARILRMAGYTVETQYWVNDVGRQAVLLWYGLRHFKAEGGKPDHAVVRCYQEANRVVEGNPDAAQEVSEVIKRLESGDSRAVDMVRKPVLMALEGVRETLERMNVSIDVFSMESQTLLDGSVNRVIEMLRSLKECREDEGAYYIDLEAYGFSGKDTKFFFTRKDGTSLYPTRDVAYHLWKMERGDRLINVLGEDHKLEAAALAAVLRLLGAKVIPENVFYAFVSLPEGKMSTRAGRVVYMDDLLKEAEARAYQEVDSRRGELPETKKREIARSVGIGSVRYNIVRVQPEKPMVFRWEDALNFEGKSAPFIQYAHARGCSILRKAGGRGEWSAEEVAEEAEIELLKLIGRYPMLIMRCAEERAPHHLAGYAHTVAQQFNIFYRDVPVLTSSVRNTRLAVVEAAVWTLRSALNTMGIDAPEEM